MFRSILSASFIAIITLVTAPHAIAQSESSKVDLRVKKALEDADIPYIIQGDSGQFKIQIKLQNNRKQNVFINSSTQKYGELEVRRIHSAAYLSPSEFSKTIANKFLVDSNRKKIGAWHTILDRKNSYYGVFAMKISADLPASQLIELIFETVQTADTMEADLTEKDIF